jgi:hypothetical protein
MMSEKGAFSCYRCGTACEIDGRQGDSCPGVTPIFGCRNCRHYSYAHNRAKERNQAEWVRKRTTPTIAIILIPAGKPARSGSREQDARPVQSVQKVVLQGQRILRKSICCHSDNIDDDEASVIKSLLKGTRYPATIRRSASSVNPLSMGRDPHFVPSLARMPAGAEHRLVTHWSTLNLSERPLFRLFHKSMSKILAMI